MLRILLVTSVKVLRHADALARRRVGACRMSLGSCAHVAALQRRSAELHPRPWAAQAHLVGIECREEPMMAGLSDIAGDERTARMVLSMIVEPNDPVTGRVLNGLGAMETLRLAEGDGAVVGLNAVDARVWRDHFDAPAAKDIAARLEQAQQSGIQVLVPGDAN